MVPGHAHCFELLPRTCPMEAWRPDVAVDTPPQTPRKLASAAALPRLEESPPRPRPLRPKTRSAVGLLIAADLFLMGLLWSLVQGIGGSALSGGPVGAVLLGATLLFGAFAGAYDIPRLRRPRSRLAVAGRQATGVGLAVAVALFVSPGTLALWAGWIARGAVLWLGVVLLRPLVSSAVLDVTGQRTGPIERVLILGSGRVAVRAARTLVSGSDDEIQVLGFADARLHGSLPRGYPGWQVSSVEDVARLAGEIGADQVLVARQDGSRKDVILLSDLLVRQGIRLRVVPDVFHRLLESMPFEHIEGLPVVEVGTRPLTGVRCLVKRAFDLAGAVCGSILILPLILVIAAGIKLTSRGPVLYRQTRLGRGGRPFTFYKFRSMLPGENGDSHRRYVTQLMTEGRAAGSNGSGQAVYKLVDDSRVTAIGVWLRRTSLDELPQLINVIRGEMSLVGPRPCLPFEYKIYKPWQRGRLDVTPGMTGLWQVTGRSLVTFEDMVLMDLFYIANWSFLLDLKLLARTIPVVIWGKGGL